MNTTTLETFDEIDEDYCFLLAKIQKNQDSVESSLRLFRNHAAEKIHLPLLKSWKDPEQYAQQVKLEVKDLDSFRSNVANINPEECVNFIRLRIEEHCFENEFPNWGLDLLALNEIQKCLSYRDTSSDDGIVEMLLEGKNFYLYFYLWW